MGACCVGWVVPFLCFTGSSVASSSWAIWPMSEAILITSCSDDGRRVAAGPRKGGEGGGSAISQAGVAWEVNVLFGGWY